MSDRSEEKARDIFFGRVNKAVKGDDVYQEAVEAIRRAKVSIRLVAESHAKAEAVRSSIFLAGYRGNRHTDSMEAMSERMGYSVPGILSVAVDNAISRALRESA